MPKTTQAKTTKITLKEVSYQETIDALAFAETTLQQLTALLISIEKSDNLKHAQKLAYMGGNYASDMANYFDCAREDLAGAKL